MNIPQSIWHLLGADTPPVEPSRDSDLSGAVSNLLAAVPEGLHYDPVRETICIEEYGSVSELPLGDALTYVAARDNGTTPTEAFLQWLGRRPVTMGEVEERGLVQLTVRLKQPAWQVVVPRGLGEHRPWVPMFSDRVADLHAVRASAIDRTRQLTYTVQSKGSVDTWEYPPDAHLSASVLLDPERLIRHASPGSDAVVVGEGRPVVVASRLAVRRLLAGLNTDVFAIPVSELHSINW